MRGRGMLAAGASLLALVAGCAPVPPPVQRVPDGPSAEEVQRARYLRDYGREPSYDEISSWRDALDLRIDRYLASHPDLGTSPRASLFRFDRRVAPEMTEEEVALLLGPPDARTGDRADMGRAAGPYWNLISARARGMWSYPGGFRLFFDNGRVSDVIVTAPEPRS